MDHMLRVFGHGTLALNFILISGGLSFKSDDMAFHTMVQGHVLILRWYEGFQV